MAPSLFKHSFLLLLLLVVSADWTDGARALQSAVADKIQAKHGFSSAKDSDVLLPRAEPSETSQNDINGDTESDHHEARSLSMDFSDEFDAEAVLQDYNPAANPSVSSTPPPL